MRSSNEHRWKPSDDVVALYLSRRGADNLGQSLSAVATTLGVPPGTMKMRMGNVNFVEDRGGLSNPSKQTRAIVAHYGQLDEPALRRVVLGILMRAGEGA